MADGRWRQNAQNLEQVTSISLWFKKAGTQCRKRSPGLRLNAVFSRDNFLRPIVKTETTPELVGNSHESSSVEMLVPRDNNSLAPPFGTSLKHSDASTCPTIPHVVEIESCLRRAADRNPLFGPREKAEGQRSPPVSANAGLRQRLPQATREG